ncbi:MAG: SIR2 family protein, partial [Thermoanaerobaculia bacterium]
MSHDFPDQLYLDRIRAALWQRGAHGNATVMVGAGMSLNARPRGAGSGRFPTWSDLARTVVDHLYPAYGGANSEHRDHALRQANATSGFLRLAQEYETAFGREALERLIADSVPDLRFEPGVLHQRLLELPWSDVFTTKWDTLLERAATRVVDRHYDVVRTIAEIPRSARPRIVKLHGTLPATRPLIFTEEDFRTYPARFAPFVNLAQQSMMENVFCLLGFSGDDPNFLYWSGWVRDHLKDYAPHIYLVGWLDLPSPRRHMLEGRGVVPVDLAHLPSHPPWPKETRDQRALEWFLSSLEEAEPYRATDWPEARDRQTPEPSADLPAVLVESTGFPLRESAEPKSSANLDELRNTVEVWRHNRQLYPGWLIAPPPIRSRLWTNTELWISTIFELLPSLGATERIEVLEELNWRLETCLVPLTAALVVAISEALSAVDPRVLDRDLPSRWVRLAASLLRAAREADDDAAFERWAEALAPHRPDHAWLGPRIAHERCLLGLARLHHDAVERALDDLDTG